MLLKIQDKPKILVVAGYDPSAGAGLLMDLKVIHKLGGYALGIPTCLTVQDTSKVYNVYDLPNSYFKESLDKIYSDIEKIDAVKIGAIYSKEIIENLVNFINNYKLRNIVFDPVLFPTQGTPLIQEDTIKYIGDLISICDVITPNIKEAEIISETEINNVNGMKKSAKRMKEKYNVQFIIIKGGHLDSDQICDLLYDGKEFVYFYRKRIKDLDLHGSGCIFSSALAFYLNKTKNAYEAFIHSEKFISKILKKPLKIGKGRCVGEP